MSDLMTEIMDTLNESKLMARYRAADIFMAFYSKVVIFSTQKVTQDQTDTLARLHIAWLNEVAKSKDAFPDSTTCQ